MTHSPMGASDSPAGSVRRLREAHAHLPALGRSMEMLSLEGVTSRRQALEMLRDEARRVAARRASSPSGTAWVQAWGARVQSWDDPRWPTREELSAIGLAGDGLGGKAGSEPIPVAVLSFDFHAAAGSDRAMELAGLGNGAPDPEGGVIVRDSTGEATGLCLEAAAKKVWNAAPGPGPDDGPRLVKNAVEHLRSMGFVEVHDLLSPGWLGPALAAMDDRGELPVDVVLFAPLDPDHVREPGDALEAQHTSANATGGWARARVRLGGGKIFADGTLNSATAWMLEPYAKPMPGYPRGRPNWSTDQLRAMMSRGLALDVQVAVHAIGDGAVRGVLDAWELALRERGRSRRSGTAAGSGGAAGFGGSGGSARGLLRIEHAELIDERDVPRFEELGAIASVQPCHLVADVDVLLRELPHRLHRVLPLRELIDAGLEPGTGLIFGSDVPIVRANPEDSILAAVERRRRGDGPERAIAMAQAITSEEAWAAFGLGRGA
ncbi:MAG: amidohydrolase family protein [Planctomycetota bacterium]|nr:amidohydrolase family protein [Planctomycetota bacterium]